MLSRLCLCTRPSCNRRAWSAAKHRRQAGSATDCYNATSRGAMNSVCAEYEAALSVCRTEIEMDATSSSSAVTERQRYLWSSAQSALLNGAPALSRVLLLAVDEAARHSKTHIPGRAAQRMCSACYTLLVPGTNCHISKQKRKRRPLSRRYVLRVRCDNCGTCSDHALPTPESSRATLAATQQLQQPQPPQQQRPHTSTSARDKAQGKQKRAKPVQPVQPQGRKRRSVPQKGSQPESTATAPGAGDGLFGFDFVAF